MSSLLSVKDLTKVYETSSERLTVLNNVNLEVEKGSKIVITGQSGSGKSTLLNIIGSIDTCTSGTVEAGPWAVTSLSEKDRALYRSKFVGFIFQFHYLLKDFTALENVYMSAYMQGVPKKTAILKAKKLLCDVGLEERLHHLPSELSGGERQRVAVARSLMNDPELILADEPTGNLDPSNSQLIGDMLFNMADKYNKTLIMVTHDRNLASRGDICYSFNKKGFLERFSVKCEGRREEK